MFLNVDKRIIKVINALLLIFLKIQKKKKLTCYLNLYVHVNLCESIFGCWDIYPWYNERIWARSTQSHIKLLSASDEF